MFVRLAIVLIPMPSRIEVRSHDGNANANANANVAVSASHTGRAPPHGRACRLRFSPPGMWRMALVPARPHRAVWS